MSQNDSAAMHASIKFFRRTWARGEGRKEGGSQGVCRTHTHNAHVHIRAKEGGGSTGVCRTHTHHGDVLGPHNAGCVQGKPSLHDEHLGACVAGGRMGHMGGGGGVTCSLLRGWMRRDGHVGAIGVLCHWFCGFC